MNIFIGCSANEKISDDYKNSTKKLLNDILDIENLNLVYGGGYTSLMKEAYECFYNKNRRINSFNVENYRDTSVKETIYTDMIAKKFIELYNNSDIFLIIPGGIGTLAELLNIIEENRILSQPKTIIIYNYNGFYNEFIQFLYKLKTNNFINENIYDLFKIESEIENIIKIIKEEEKKI